MAIFLSFPHLCPRYGGWGIALIGVLLSRPTFGTVTSLLVITVHNFMANKGRSCPSWPINELAVSKATLMARGVAEAFVRANKVARGTQ